ncbi:hypothetical protein I552_7448 [Mycobacterium xenopi 3993]|nr:hypothetical protein I552_7448 [Mycobacterium xenopi 3993]
MHIVTLRDPSAPVVARYAPSAGMIGISLTDSGVELLGQRGGLDAYLAAGKTMGIPLLYPWANRLGNAATELTAKKSRWNPMRSGCAPTPTVCRSTDCWPAIPGGG